MPSPRNAEAIERALIDAVADDPERPPEADSPVLRGFVLIADWLVADGDMTLTICRDGQSSHLSRGLCLHGAERYSVIHGPDSGED